MNRIERIEAALSENEAVDRDFPPPKTPYVRLQREDLRALLRLVEALRHYAQHEKGCGLRCTCGLADVLREIDAKETK